MAKKMDRYLEITRHLRQEVWQRRRGAKESPPWSCRGSSGAEGAGEGSRAGSSRLWG